MAILDFLSLSLISEISSVILLRNIPWRGEFPIINGGYFS